jgi:3-oxoacyl-[acyl-carrier protein] reductase
LKELQGRVALVTGAARNIGRAIALELAAAGASVVVNARKSRDELDAVAAEAGGMAILADVTDAKAVEDMVKQAVGRLGRIDILVNNAAVRTGSWDEVTGILLDGAWNCIEKCRPQYSIVNIGGLSAHTGAAGRPHVVAAKLGLVGLTRALAHDLAAKGVTVNCVVPGLIDTERSSPSAHGDKVGPIGRRGTPQDVAAAVRFLAGPGARYITGQVLHVKGGALT